MSKLDLEFERLAKKVLDEERAYEEEQQRLQRKPMFVPRRSFVPKHQRQMNAAIRRFHRGVIW